ncbi:MAG: PEP-CTERM sorting domain-containing protein [Sphingobium sp.]
MKMKQMLMTAGAAALIGGAMPAPAQASWWCWFGKCGGNSSTGGTTTSSSGGTPSSSGGATPVPEPEQMALFAMGSAVLAFRILRGRRKSK